MRHRWQWLILLAATLTAQHTHAQEEADVTTEQQAQAKYTVIQQRDDRLLVELPNRMIVIAQELRTSPVVSAQVWVRTGSIYEQEHVGAGLSHFLEHLVSGGTTTTRTEAESNEILGRIGAQMNAATSLDTVRYYINTTSAHTAEAVELLGDWMRNSTIPQAEYERERDVIQREFDMGQGDPGRIFWKLTQQARFAAHPARHPTIGYIDEFLAITRDEIYDFYKRMYVPNNMIFVVVGDIDKQAVVDQIARDWADVPVAPIQPLSFPVEPVPTKPAELTGEAAMANPRVRMAWPGTQLAAAGDYELDLLAVILGQGESSRLVRAVRDEKRLVNSIDAYNLSFAWGPGFFGIDADIAVPAPRHPDEDPADLVAQATTRARNAVLEQVALIATRGVTAEELARAKRQVLASVLNSSQSAEATASRLARDLFNTSDPDYLTHYAQKVQAIRIEDVNKIAASMLDREKTITVTLMPAQGKPEPMARPPAVDGADGYEQQEVLLDNFFIVRDLRKHLAGRDQAAAAATLEPIERFVFPNGLRLLVQRSTLVPAVSIQMYSLGGLLSDEPGREGVAYATAVMRMKGTETHTALQIAQKLEDLGADLSTSAANNTSYARGFALKEDWRTVLELLAEVTLTPTFPEDEWQKMQPRIIAAIRQSRDSWSGELQATFRETYFGRQHPWSQVTMGREQVVAALSADDLRAFHEEQLGASRTVIAVFGDVDPQRVRDAVAGLFAAMPDEALAPFDPPREQQPAARVHIAASNKSRAAVEIGFGPGPSVDSRDIAAVDVLMRVMSSFPSGWLQQALRGEGPGLAYVAHTFHVSGVVPGYIGVLFNTDPASLPEAVSRAMIVVDRARDSVIDDDTLAKAKASVLTREFMSKQTNGDRAAEAALNELYGRGLDYPDIYRREIEQLTPELLQLIAQTYLRKPVAVILAHGEVDEAAVTEALEAQYQP